MSSSAAGGREQALRCKERYALVTGRAGAGKTHLAIEKALTFIEEVSSGRVLFISFSRSSRIRVLSRLMRQTRQPRWKEREGREHELLLRNWYEVATFHSLALNLLSRYGHRVGLPCLPMVFPRDELLPSGSSCTAIDCLEVAHVRKGGTLCHDGLLKCAIRLLGACPDLRAMLGKAFPLVVVDEYQDTDGTHAAFLSLVSCGARQLFCLGDLPQAIHEFTGAPDGLRPFDPMAAFPFGGAVFEIEPLRDPGATRFTSPGTQQLERWARAIVQGSEYPATQQLAAYLTPKRFQTQSRIASFASDAALQYPVLSACHALAERGQSVAVLTLGYDTLFRVYEALSTNWRSRSPSGTGTGLRALPVRLELSGHAEGFAVRSLKGAAALGVGADPGRVRATLLSPICRWVRRQAASVPDMRILDIGGQPLSHSLPQLLEAASEWLDALPGKGKAGLLRRRAEMLVPRIAQCAAGRRVMVTELDVDRAFSDIGRYLSTIDIAVRSAGEKGIALMPIWQAKNREFDGVCLVLRAPADGVSSTRQGQLARELYVAASRAKAEFFCRYLGGRAGLPPPSKTLEQFDYRRVPARGVGKS